MSDRCLFRGKLVSSAYGALVDEINKRVGIGGGAL